MRAILFTTKVVVILLFGGWFDQAHHKENGQRIKRICWAQIVRLQRTHPLNPLQGETFRVNPSLIKRGGTGVSLKSLLVPGARGS